MPARPPCNARIAGPDGARVGALFLLPHTVGIELLALMTYASMPVKLRGVARAFAD